MKTIYRLQLRLLATRGRIIALGLLGALGILLALAIRSSNDLSNDAFGYISSYGLAGIIPVTTLVLASASLGDPAEDATLVHIWLRPISRAHIAFASWLAALTLTIPLAVVPMTIAAAVCNVNANFVLGTFLACLLGSAAYAALFVGFGLRVQRALPWGLAYVLIWEGAIASAGAGLSRIAVRGYTRSILKSFTPDQITMKYPVNRYVAIAVLVGLSVAGLGYSVRRLRKSDIA
jgi:ABC-2 type transport system permease protein